MDEFDRVFDGDDVLVEVVVDVVDHRRQGRRFARTGRTGHQYEAGLVVADLNQRFRQFQLLHGEDLARNLTEDAPHAVVVVEVVAAETGQPRNLMREVEVVRLHEFGPAFGGQTDLLEHLLHHLRSEDDVVQRLNVAVDARFGREVDREVKVRSAEAEHLAEVAVDFRFLFHDRSSP